MSDALESSTDTTAGASEVRAVDGGVETRGVGEFYPWPLPDPEVHDALMRAFADGSWGRYTGPHSASLRAALADLHGLEHITLCSSGTLAIELALRGLKISADDEVILGGYDFPGNFRAIEAVGAKPVLVDIDPDTWCVAADQLNSALSRHTRAIIVSHLHGGIARMREIVDWAHGHSVAVVEDACQAPLATVNGRPAGAWGDAGVLSFGGSKLLTAGRGGAVMTRHSDVHQRMKVYINRGNDAFPLCELQAAVLLPQLRQLPKRNVCRRAALARILSATSRFSALQPVKNNIGNEPSCYKFGWLFVGQHVGWRCTREEFLVAAHHERIPLDVGFRGFALRSSRRCRVAGELVHSTAAASQTIVLHHPVLLADESEELRMIDRLSQILEAASTYLSDDRKSS